MKPLLPAHRAAEEFAGVIDGHPGDEAADRYASLAGVVTLLRTHEHPEPRPEFVADLRSRLLLAAETELVAPTPSTGTSRAHAAPTRSPGRHQRPLAAAVAALVLVGGTAGMAAAAQGSVAGDPLYPLKLGIEHASVALHASDAGKGADLLGQAGNRLAEAQSLVSGNDSPAEIAATLDRFTASAGDGADLLFRSYQQNGDDQAITTVRSFAARQMATLARLAPVAPSPSRDALERAADTVAGIDQQARVLCAACSRSGALSVPHGLAGPSSAASLDTLIQHPAQMAEAQARAARALAAAAEAAGKVAATKPVTTGNGTSGPRSTGPAVPGAGGTSPDGGTTSTATGSRPVRDLVDGVTQKTGGLTNGLSDTVNGVTGGVNTALGGNGSSDDLGDTLTNTVGGLLGGLTGP
ncbi:MAG TPA: DUF5667 domain-containing protein [Marmoricola sp.]|nr:DUF5667 domain-containing protein [Marmoricola sp.]